MTRIKSAILGEDVPITILYTDPDTGDPVDPDGGPDASVTITKSGTTLVDGVSMTNNDTGDFEYVWDTSSDEDGTGEYVIEVSADFDSETKIERVRLPLK